MTQSCITEIIPGDAPEWFNEHIKSGDLFRYVIKRMKELEGEDKTYIDDLQQKIDEQDICIKTLIERLQK